MAILVFSLVAVAGLTSIAIVVSAIRAERDHERMGRWRAEVAHQRIYGSETRRTPSPPAGLDPAAEAGIDDEGLFI